MRVLDEFEGRLEIAGLLDEVFQDGQHLLQDGEILQALEEFCRFLLALLQAVGLDHVLQRLLFEKLGLFFLFVDVTSDLPHLRLYSIERLKGQRKLVKVACHMLCQLVFDCIQLYGKLFRHFLDVFLALYLEKGRS